MYDGIHIHEDTCMDVYLYLNIFFMHTRIHTYGDSFVCLYDGIHKSRCTLY